MEQATPIAVNPICPELHNLATLGITLPSVTCANQPALDFTESPGKIPL